MMTVITIYDIITIGYCKFVKQGAFISLTNKDALSSVESRLLGYKIRSEEAIRPRAVVLLSSESRAASEKVKSCFRPTVTQKKKKTARGLGGD